eukprot:511423-Amphidinium_carterae.2
MRSRLLLQGNWANHQPRCHPPFAAPRHRQLDASMLGDASAPVERGQQLLPRTQERTAALGRQSG